MQTGFTGVRDSTLTIARNERWRGSDADPRVRVSEGEIDPSDLR